MKRIKKILKEHRIFLIIILTVLILVYLSYANDGIIKFLIASDTEKVIEFVNSFGILSWLVFMLLVILEVVLAPIPPLVLYIAGGILFGTVLGGTLTLIGNVIGALIAFMLARKYGRKIFEETLSEKTKEKFNKFTKKYGGFSIFLLRINPITSSDIFSYLAGLTKMSTKSLLIGTILGLAPLIFLQTYIGSDFVRDSPLLTLIFIIVSVLYMLFFLYGLWLVIKKRRNKKSL